jgi:hypothetical protein
MVENNHIPAQQEIKDGFIYRTFYQDVNPEELVWHWDENDRYVLVLNESDWKYQEDNQFPILLKKNTELFIKAGQWHRVIKGKTNLELKIKEKPPENNQGA